MKLLQFPCHFQKSVNQGLLPSHSSRRIHQQRGERRLMLGSNVSVEVALLREPGLADGARELGLDAALVVPVPPERRENRVDAIAIGAAVLLLPPPLRLPLLDGLLRRLRTFVALEDPVAGQRGHQREISVAIGAKVFPGAPAVYLALLVLERHGPQVPGVADHRRSRRQRGHRPVRRAVAQACKRANGRKEF